MPFTVTITDPPYNCPTDGTSDCATAFAAWHADAQGQDCILHIPAHTYSFQSDPITNSAYFGGVTSLVCDGYGATIVEAGGSVSWGASFSLYSNAGGSFGPPDNNAFIQRAAIGDTQVTCINSSDSSIFPVGRWVVISGLDQQGSGQPQNWAFFEYRQVTGNSGGVVTFATPLTMNYETYWPFHNGGSNLEPNQGGPAAVFLLGPDWGATFEFQGLTFQTTGQRFSKSRSVTFKDFTVTGSGGQIIPTTNQIYKITGASNFSARMEMDKVIEHVIIDGPVTCDFECQSSVPNLLEVRNGATVTLIGTPKRLFASDSTFPTLRFGPSQRLGHTQEVELTNCNVVTFELSSIDSNLGTFTRSGGVLTSTAGLQPWGTPNNPASDPNAGAMLIGGVHVSSYGAFSLTRANSNDSFNTTLPTSPDTWPTDTLGITQHYCPKARFNSIAGGSALAAQAYPGGQNRPLFERVFVSYPSGLSGDGTQVLWWGRIVSVKVNVISPAAGTLHLAGQFDNMKVIDSLGTIYDWGVQVNLNLPGLQTFTTDNYAPSGGVGPYWSTDGAGPWVNPAAPTSAVFTIEYIADQGFGSDATLVLMGQACL
jgi:hypothetical protein